MNKIFKLLLVSYGIKIVTNFIAVIPSVIVVAILEKVENFETEDTVPSFNPFKKT